MTKVAAGQARVDDHEVLRPGLARPRESGGAVDAVQGPASTGGRHRHVHGKDAQAVESFHERGLVVLRDPGALARAQVVGHAHTNEEGRPADGGRAEPRFPQRGVVARGGAAGEEAQGEESNRRRGERLAAHDECYNIP